MLKEVDVATILDTLELSKVKTIPFLPDSRLNPLYSRLLEDERFRSVVVPNESTGVCIAAGSWLGGERAVMIMENSGLRVASEALARLGLESQIPVTIITSYRGDFGEENWWGINHGITMEPLLNALRIPYVVVRKSEELENSIKWAILHAETSLYHTCVVIGRSVIE